MKIICCIMFKNEEEVLERCIKSVLPYVTEFVLYDTGSKDSSISIASKYTNKVHIGKFTNFVETKNKVLDIAEKSDCELVLWMDADEYLQDFSRLEFENSLKQLENFDSLITDIQDVSQDDNILSEYIRPRVWKNHKGFRFNGPGIHEYIEISESRLTNKKIKIGHKHKTKNKDYVMNFQFYLKILHQYEEKNPKDLRCLFYLGRTYQDNHDFEKAIKYHEKYQETCKEINYYFMDEYWYSILETGRAYLKLSNIEKAIECFERCVQIVPERAEAYKELGNIFYYRLKDVEKAKNILEPAKDLTVQEHFQMFTDLYSYKYSILDLLSLVYYDLKDFKKGLECIDELLSLPNINFYDPLGRIKNNKRFFVVKEKYFTINSYFDNVFLINLESRPDRFEKVSEKLKETGIYVEKFRGYDGELLKPFIDKDVLVRRTGGYLGCLLSHLEVLKISKQRGYEKVLILEDDLAIHKDINELFLKQINEVENNYKDWDCIYFGHANFTGAYKISDGGFGNSPITSEKFEGYVTEAKNTWTCHSRAYSKRMIEKILEYYENNGYHYEMDRLIASEFQNNKEYKIYLVYPQLFVQNDIYSNNDESGFSANHFDRFINTYYSTKEDYI